MSSDLELLSGFFVDVRGSQNRVAVDSGRKRNGSRNTSARALRSVDDLASRLIQQFVIKGSQTDTDFLALHFLSFNNSKFVKEPGQTARPTYSTISATTPAPTV